MDQDINLDWLAITVHAAAGLICACLVAGAGGILYWNGARRAARAVARGRLSREEALRAYRNSARKIFNLVFYGAALALTALYVALIVTSDLPLGLNHPEPSAALMALVVPAILSVFTVHTLTSEPKRLTELLAYPFEVRARRDDGLKWIALLYSMALIVLVAPGALLLFDLSVFL